MIVRIQRRENPFVQIDKNPLNDPKLSFKAKGMLAYLLSKPQGWTVTIADLENHATDGRHSIRAGLRELRNCAYAELKVSRGSNGKLSGQEWVIFECPTERPVSRLSVADFQITERPVSRLSEKPSLGKSHTSNNNSTSNNKEERDNKISPTPLNSVASVNGILDDLGEAFYNRPRGGFPTEPELRNALEVTKRPDWQAEKMILLNHATRLKENPSDFKYQRAGSLEQFLEQWSRMLDKARTYEPSNSHQSAYERSKGQPPVSRERHAAGF